MFTVFSMFFGKFSIIAIIHMLFLCNVSKSAIYGVIFAWIEKSTF